MSDIKFNCWSCKNEIVTDEKNCGKRADCPHCKADLFIPPACSFKPPILTATPPPPVQENQFTFTCPHCGNGIKIESKDYGKWVSCPTCGCSSNSAIVNHWENVWQEYWMWIVITTGVPFLWWMYECSKIDQQVDHLIRQMPNF